MLGEVDCTSTPATTTFPAATTSIETGGDGSGMGSTEASQSGDSCSQLQYLHTACAATPQLINKSVRDSVTEILGAYEDGDGFNMCQWIRANNLPQVVVNFFNHC